MSHDGLIHPAKDCAEQIAALEAQVQKLKEEAATADEMYDAQYKKFEDCPHSFGGDTRYLCACSFDEKSDVCAVHAPQLREALKRVKILQTALNESVKLQSHYAELLNMHDGGERRLFEDSAEWIARLIETGTLAAPEKKA